VVPCGKIDHVVCTLNDVIEMARGNFENQTDNALRDNRFVLAAVRVS
jgi:hypothetical protein